MSKPPPISLQGCAESQKAVAGSGTASFDSVVVQLNLVFAKPPGTESQYNFSPANQGGNGSLDSDVDATSLLPITLAEAETRVCDAGLIPVVPGGGEGGGGGPPGGGGELPGGGGGSGGNSTVNGRAWMDSDGDGVQDAVEVGFTHASVLLYAANGTLIASMTTASDGLYSFTGLAAGDYYIVFVKPFGQESLYNFSPADQGGDDSLDSDIDGTGVLTFTLLESSTRSWDVGLVPLL